MGYLETLLQKYDVSEQQVKSLQWVREQLEGVLTGSWKTGDPRFYYGGSYAKNTMVNLSFDLDLVVYFPPTDMFTVKVLYESVERRLVEKSYKLSRHNVALRLPYDGGFYVDVVVGRAMDSTYRYANLYASERDTTKQTSIKTHIDLVRRNGGYQEVVRLLKIWKMRHNLNVGSFLLELATARALQNNRGDLENRFVTVLEFLRDRLTTARLEDPANSSNVITDDISSAAKSAIQQQAARSCAANTWQQVVW